MKYMDLDLPGYAWDLRFLYNFNPLYLDIYSDVACIIYEDKKSFYAALHSFRMSILNVVFV